MIVCFLGYNNTRLTCVNDNISNEAIKEKNKGIKIWPSLFWTIISEIDGNCRGRIAWSFYAIGRGDENLEERNGGSKGKRKKRKKNIWWKIEFQNDQNPFEIHI